MHSKEPFIKHRLKSIGFAYRGMLILLKSEASIKIQVVIAILVTIAGFIFNISKTEWLAQILAIGLVMSIEGMNTAIEYLADFIHPDKHHKIGIIKDVAAGAVFIAALIAVIIAGIIYLPKLF